MSSSLSSGHDVGTAPAAGLVDVPAHLDHDDVAELAGLDVLCGLDVGGGGAALGADGDDLFGAFDGGEEVARVGHGVRGGLFYVCVAAGLDGLDAVAGVLEVGGGDEDGVDVVAGVEGLVVGDHVDLASGGLLDRGDGPFARELPDVGDSDQLEVQVLLVGGEGGHIAAQHAVSSADDADADAVVGADDFGVTPRGLRGGDGKGCGAEFDEVAAGGFGGWHGGGLLVLWTMLCIRCGGAQSCRRAKSTWFGGSWASEGARQGEGPGLKPLVASGLFVGLKPHAPSEVQEQKPISFGKDEQQRVRRWGLVPTHSA